MNSTVHIYPINGASHDVAADATAFGHRDATYATVIAGMWPDPADNEANTRWVQDYYAAIAPHSQDGGYVNFASADDQVEGRRELRRQLRQACRRSSGATTRRTCSTSTRTSSPDSRRLDDRGVVRGPGPSA